MKTSDQRFALTVCMIAAAGLLGSCAGSADRSKSAGSMAGHAPATIPGIGTPPVAPVRVVTDDYFGTKVDDPYRYMENLKDPEVAAWFQGQADYASKVLESLPQRAALLARIKELDAAVPYWASPPWPEPNGDRYYTKKFTAEPQAKTYRIDRVTGAHTVVMDADKLGSEGRTASVQYFIPSPDGKLILYGVAMGGSEATELRLRDPATLADLPFSIDRIETAYTAPDWLPDSSGFVYSRRRQLEPGAPATEGYKLTASYLHRLNTDVASDVKVFAKDLAPEVAMADTDFPSVSLPPDSEFAIGQIKVGDNPELTLYSARRADLGTARAHWKPICGQSDGVKSYAVHGATIYLVTTSGAPRLKIISTPLASPDFAGASAVVPESGAVVLGGSAGRDALYVNISDGPVLGALRVPYDHPREARRIPSPPDEPSISCSALHPLLDGAVLWTSSWTHTGRAFAYDPATGKETDVTATPTGPYDHPEGLEAREVNVRSHDGTMVPLSIVFKKNIKLDGSNPCLLEGYGSYGLSTYPGYSSILLAWLERGGILAHAHVRGGGELGKPWHEGGRMKTKPNTWKDFIACAQYLVEHKYTSPAKLAGQGGSAGGILIGRTITDRPDLFAAAIINVGATDTLRAETTTNGVPNIQEFGSFTTREGFEGLLEMSSYAKVRDGVAYPAVLLIHGMNDPRVEPWESGKMAARLQAATTSGKPVLLRVDYDSGHGGGGTTDKWQRLAADEWGFLLWRFGRGEP